MADILLDVEAGRSTGTRPSRRMRAGDKIPGVLYGRKLEPVSVAVDRRALRAALNTEAGLNALLTLSLGGEEHLAVVRELQRHPVRHNVIHVDFMAVDRDQELKLDVPIVLHGEADKVHAIEGATVDQVLHTLHVTATPVSIPNEIPVDISGLEVGHSIRVGDLMLPAGVSTETDPDESVVTATVVRAAAEAEEGAAVEAPAEAAVEGGEAAAEASEG